MVFSVLPLISTTGGGVFFKMVEHWEVSLVIEFAHFTTWNGNLSHFSSLPSDSFVFTF